VDGADIVVPRTERGYHPLCAVYTRACLEPIARRLADGRLKLVGLFDDVRVRVVTAEALAAFGDPDRLLANVNTPLEYRAIEANRIQS
jgi:molybdopterin-guanine dinucleotide biosynthesis protein A